MSNVVQQQGSEGYKQTEVGIVPVDWCCRSVKSFTVAHKQGFYTKDNYVNNGTRLVRITDINNPVIDYESMPQLNISKLDFQQYKIRKGDFLFARSGAIGRYGIVDAEVNAVFASYIIRFNFDHRQVLNSFFGFLYQSDAVLRQLLSITQGSSNININANNIKSLIAPIPSIEEQRAIANALSDVDALFTLLENLIAKKRDIKTATMQQLLTGKKRLPPFDQTHTGFKQTELGEIPEDWEVKSLGAAATFIGSGKTSTKGTGEYPLYGSTGQIGTCKDPEYDGDSILVARVGANAGRLKFVTGDYGVSDNTIIVKLGGGSDIGFYKYQLIRTNLNTLVFGSGQPLITGSQLKAILLPVPTPKEQAVIAGLLSDMDKEIEGLLRRLNKTQQLKQGMMQELLTGRTRLV